MKKYTKDNIVEGINAKIDSLMQSDQDLSAYYNTMRIFALHYPVEVEQNVLEWVNNEPLSHVDCHGISIKSVMDCLNLPDSCFLSVLKNFIEFKEEGFYSTAICYEMLPGWGEL